MFVINNISHAHTGNETIDMQCNLTPKLYLPHILATQSLWILQCIHFPVYIKPTQYYYVNNTDMWHITICLGMIRMQIIHKTHPHDTHSIYLYTIPKRMRIERPEMHQEYLPKSRFWSLSFVIHFIMNAILCNIIQLQFSFGCVSVTNRLYKYLPIYKCGTCAMNLCIE